MKGVVHWDRLLGESSSSEAFETQVDKTLSSLVWYHNTGLVWSPRMLVYYDVWWCAQVKKLEFRSPLAIWTIPPVHRTAGRPPRLLLGLAPSTARTLSSIVARSWGNRRGLVEQGQSLRPGKKTRVPSPLPDGQRRGMQSASLSAVLHSWLSW